MTMTARETQVKEDADMLVATIQGTVTIADYDSFETTALWKLIQLDVEAWLRQRARGSM